MKWKRFERKRLCLIEVVSFYHLRGGPAEYRGTPFSGLLCPSRHSEQAPTKQTYREVMLYNRVNILYRNELYDNIETCRNKRVFKMNWTTFA